MLIIFEALSYFWTMCNGMSLLTVTASREKEINFFLNICLLAAGAKVGSFVKQYPPTPSPGNMILEWVDLNFSR